MGSQSVFLSVLRLSRLLLDQLVLTHASHRPTVNLGLLRGSLKDLVDCTSKTTDPEISQKEGSLRASYERAIASLDPATAQLIRVYQPSFEAMLGEGLAMESREEQDTSQDNTFNGLQGRLIDSQTELRNWDKEIVASLEEKKKTKKRKVVSPSQETGVEENWKGETGPPNISRTTSGLSLASMAVTDMPSLQGILDFSSSRDYYNEGGLFSTDEDED